MDTYVEKEMIKNSKVIYSDIAVLKGYPIIIAIRILKKELYLNTHIWVAGVLVIFILMEGAERYLGYGMLTLVYLWCSG